MMMTSSDGACDETLNERSIKQKLNSETVIRLFLEQLNCRGNGGRGQIAAVKEFEEYFFQQLPRLQEQMILKLFLGDTYSTLGILHFIGLAA